MKKTLLSIGHGYSAQALASLIGLENWHIIGTTRSAEKAKQLSHQGIEPIIWPTEQLWQALVRADYVPCGLGVRRINA
jgi:adenosylmethionine-8-amino-7-oxononanoate aminotransferase